MKNLVSHWQKFNPKKWTWIALGLSTVIALIAFPAMAADNSALSLISSKATAGGGQNYSLSLQTLILLTSLSFLPTVLLMMTSFTRIIIVLSLLRQAIWGAIFPS